MGSLPTPLSAIPPNAVEFDFTPPQYSNIFAQTVGNAATETDGWDAIFADASQVLQTFPDFLTSLDFPLSILDAAIGEVDQVWEQPFADSLSASITGGQAEFDKYNVALTNNTPPPPGTAPGGTSGGGGTPKATCTDIMQFDIANTKPYTQQVMFRNVDTVPITISSKTLDDPTPGTFKVTDQIPPVLASQKSAPIFVTQERPAAFGYKATFTIVHSGKGNPAVLCIEMSNGNINVSGGGGTSGPPLLPGPAPVGV